MPVRSVTVALPPRISMVDTITFVASPKNRKTRCATAPQRAYTISRNVWQYGACSLSLAASIANRRTWTVAPAAYHHGPEIPNLYAVAEDWRRVAAHVHAETIPAAMRPGGTLRDAELNSSALLGFQRVYRAWILVMRTMNALKNRPMPMTTPYPAPWGRIAVVMM